MAHPLVRAHIEAEARLQRLVKRTLTDVWGGLPGYDREDVAQWLAAAVPIVEGAQRQSIALTDALVTRRLGRPPVGLNAGELIEGLRAGTPTSDVYERPFVTLWAALGAGQDFADASSAALARATASGVMDVQMAMRSAAEALETAGVAEYGYQRVANADACEFCQEVDGAYVKASDGFAMALHNACNCGLEPLTEPHPRAVELPDGTRVRPYQYGPLNDRVAVHEHGELGPVLGSPDHDFTTESQALA